MLQNLYQLVNPIDVTSGMLQLVTRELTGDDTAQDVFSALYTVPNDRVFVLRAMSSKLTPGTGQAVSFGTFLLRGEVGAFTTSFHRYPDSQFGTADIPVFGSWSGELLIGPGERLGAYGRFNAATNSNSVRVDLFGISIPRGNIQQA